MVKRSRLQSEDPKRPTLQMPRAQAEEGIRRQIEKGKQLLQVQIRNDDELRKARSEYRKWSDYNVDFLKLIIDTNDFVDSYNIGAVGFFITRSFLEQVKDHYSYVEEKVNRLDSILERLALFPEKQVAHLEALSAPEIGRHSQPSVEDPSVIWVVHGRNLEIRDGMFAFLRSVGLKPKEWSQAVNEAAKETGQASPYVFSTLETVLSKRPVVLVLMTPDDEAILKEPLRKADDPPYESRPTGQARPNVLFEAGMAMGVLRDRTVLVEIGTMRHFTDIGGILILRLNNSPQKRQELVERLKTIGCPVETSGYDWYSSGNFELSARMASAESEPGTTGQSSEPNADEAKILKELGNPSFSRDRYVASLADNIKMSPDKVRYYLDEMVKRGLVERTPEGIFSGATYQFTHPGREYAVKYNIL